MTDQEKYPLYVDGIAIYSRDIKNYFCYLCTEQSDESWEDHLKNETHCSLLAAHTFSDNPATWCAPLTQFETIFKNFISKCGNEYYCHLCHVKLSCWCSTISHTTDTQHEAVRKTSADTINTIELPLSLSFELLSSNHIFLKTRDIGSCVICNVEFQFWRSRVLDHLSTIGHKENLQIFTRQLKTLDRIRPTLKQVVNEDSLTKDEGQCKIKLKETDGENSKLESDTDISFSDIEEDKVVQQKDAKISLPSTAPRQRLHFARCDICKLEISMELNGIMDHNKSEGHQKRKFKLFEENASSIPEDLDPSIIEDPGVEYFMADEQCNSDKNLFKIVKVWNKPETFDKKDFIWCKACKYDLSQTKVSKHLATTEHKINTGILAELCLDIEALNIGENYKDYLSVRNEKSFKCHLCNTSDRFNNIDRHIGSECHKKLVAIFNYTTRSKTKCMEEISSRSNTGASNSTSSEHPTTSDASTLDSLPSKFNIENYSPNDEIDFVVCPACNDRMLAVHENITYHKESSRHKKKYQKFAKQSLFTSEQSFNTNNDNLHKYYFKEAWPSDKKIIVLEEVSTSRLTNLVKTVFWCTACDFKTDDIFTVNKHLDFKHTKASREQEKKLPKTSVLNQMESKFEKISVNAPTNHQPWYFFCDICDAKFQSHSPQEQYKHFTESKIHREKLIELSKYISTPLQTIDIEEKKEKDPIAGFKLGDEIYFLQCNMCSRRIFKGDKNIQRHYMQHKTDKRRAAALENILPKELFVNVEDDSHRFVFEANMEPKGSIFAFRRVTPGCTIDQGTLIPWCKICDTDLLTRFNIVQHLNGSRHKRCLEIAEESDSDSLHEDSCSEDDMQLKKCHKFDNNAVYKDDVYDE